MKTTRISVFEYHRNREVLRVRGDRKGKGGGGRGRSRFREDIRVQRIKVHRSRVKHLGDSSRSSKSVAVVRGVREIGSTSLSP